MCDLPISKSVVVNHIHIDQNTLHTNTSLHVLHISDMHLENISVTPKQLYETLKGERIDLIALTGDFLDKAKSIPKLEKYLTVRSEERRVGKECRSRWEAWNEKKKRRGDGE